MKSKLFAAGTVVALVAGLAAAAELKSGPQVGDKIRAPFYPLNINGPTPGKKECLVCRNGDKPVVMVFARSADDKTLQALIKKIDEATAKNSDCEMGSFVVVLTDDDGTEQKLTDLAKKESYKKVVLSIDNPAGPKEYSVAKDADVTVVLYTDRQVKANYAFKKGELKDKDVDSIVKDVAKIVPAK
jgi:hypothetical protein